jgi:plastocyanin
MSRLFACAVLIVATAFVAPVSQAAAPHAAAHSPAKPVITISNFGFHGNLTVRPGVRVTVKNKDGVTHTLTDKRTHLFNTGRIRPGHTKTFRAPSKVGKYPFGCKIHPEMKGTLIVRRHHR